MDKDWDDWNDYEIAILFHALENFLGYNDDNNASDYIRMTYRELRAQLFFEYNKRKLDWSMFYE